jgi:hypothetical protein
MNDDVNNFLMGTGGRSASFKNINDRVWGEIVHTELRQQTSFEENTPLFWDDGKPRMQLVVTLQTDLAEDEDDDGVRKIYAKGQMLQAIRKAIVKAGEKQIRSGGRLLVQYVSDAEPKRKGMSGAKQFFAKYEAPVYAVGVDEPGLDYADEAPDPDDIPF